MQETTSPPTVKGAIIETIYNAAAKAYPALAQVAAQVCARKKEELGARSFSPARKGVEVRLEIEERTKSETPTPSALPREEPSAEDELRQIANLQFLALCLMNEYLVSLCEKRGITLSPELQIALLENMLCQAYRTGVDKKVPRELA